RPWRPRHVLWGAIIPVVPLTLTVDSVVSNLRTYTTDELRAIVAGIDAPDFVWDIGTAPIPGAGLHATYVLGWRQSKAERTIARRTG
ncbi:MAG TPA: hypothetical protein VFH51_10145, partial [Myxococcota bacterium]|nr:hypothetical protein [Myxococcota bacterium]